MFITCNVQLSVGEDVMSSEVIYTTNYTYCPIDLTNGEYRLNITTINGGGTGIWNSDTTMFITCNVQLSVGEDVMSSEVIYTINYTYCPIDLTNGEYRLNITTINGGGTGICNSDTTMFITCNVQLIVGEDVISSKVIYTTNYTYCPIDLTNGILYNE